MTRPPREKANQGVVAMIGAFPPPLHGASAINAAVSALLRAEDFKVQKFDTARPLFRAHRLSSLLRPIRVIIELARFWGWSGRTHPQSSYFSLAGGFAQFYDLAFAGLSRMKGLSLVAHHHSFRYIHRKWWLFDLLRRVLGPECTHVFLCPRMEQEFRRLYGWNHRTLVVSNQAFLRMEGPTSERTSCRSVGYISNITREKGIEEVLDVARRLMRAGSSLKIVIAGGIGDPALQRWFAEQISECPNILYRGAVYGETKEQFFRDIDALIFPTRYRNEAEPLVLLEAMRRGIPSIANDRGCISGMLAAGAGIIVKNGSEFSKWAVCHLLDWENSSMAYQNARTNVSSGSHRYEIESLQQRRAFLRLFSRSNDR